MEKAAVFAAAFDLGWWGPTVSHLWRGRDRALRGHRRPAKRMGDGHCVRIKERVLLTFVAPGFARAW